MSEEVVDPIGPWAEGVPFATADFAFTIATYQRLSSYERRCYENDDIPAALEWGKLTAEILADAVEILRNPDHEAWILPRDREDQNENHE